MNGTLDLLEDSSENEILEVMEEVKNQLVCLKEQIPCVYRDLKPANIMFRCISDHEYVIHIIDIGSCHNPNSLTYPPIELFDGPKLTSIPNNEVLVSNYPELADNLLSYIFGLTYFLNNLC